MRKLLLIQIISASLLCLLSSICFAEKPVGTIIFVQGETFAISANGVKRPLHRRAKIFLKDTLVTGSESHCHFKMIDAAIISLQSNTRFAINAYEFNGNYKSDLSLIKGGFRTITGAVTKLAPDAYKVKTALSTMSVRGTYWGAALATENDTAVQYTATWQQSNKESGQVLITPLNQTKPFIIGPGQAYDIAKVTASGEVQGLNQLPSGIFESLQETKQQTNHHQGGNTHTSVTEQTEAPSAAQSDNLSNSTISRATLQNLLRLLEFNSNLLNTNSSFSNIIVNSFIRTQIEQLIDNFNQLSNSPVFNLLNSNQLLNFRNSEFLGLATTFASGGTVIGGLAYFNTIKTPIILNNTDLLSANAVIQGLTDPNNTINFKAISPSFNVLYGRWDASDGNSAIVLQSTANGVSNTTISSDILWAVAEPTPQLATGSIRYDNTLFVAGIGSNLQTFNNIAQANLTVDVNFDNFSVLASGSINDGIATWQFSNQSGILSGTGISINSLNGEYHAGGVYASSGSMKGILTGDQSDALVAGIAMSAPATNQKLQAIVGLGQ